MRTSLCLLSSVLGVGACALAAELDYSKVGVYGTCFDFCDFSCYKIRWPVEREGYLEHMAKRIDETHAQGKLNLVGLYCFDRVKHSRPIDEYKANADKILDAIDLSKVHALFLSEENVTWSKGLEVLNALYDHVKARTDVPVYQWYSMPMIPHPKQRADGWILDPYGMRADRFRKHIMKYVVLGKPAIDCLHASPPGKYSFKNSEEHLATADQIRLCREFNVPMFFYSVDKQYGSPAIWLHTDDPETVSVREWLLAEISRIRATDTSKLPLTSADYSTGRAVQVAGDRENRYAYEERFEALTECFIDDAFINGFQLLRWDGEDERLLVRSRRRGRQSVELIYHFTSEFEMTDMVATLAGRSSGGRATVATSINGHRFEHAATAEQDGAFELVSNTADNEEFKGKEFWVRVLAEVGEQPAEPVAFDRFHVTCSVTPPERREIELALDTEGSVRYVDDFQTQKHLHLAEIDNLDLLEWQRGYVGTHGVKGRGVVVSLRQKFVSPQALASVRVKMTSTAHRALGSSNTVGLSLDGKEPLLTETTLGREKVDGRAQGKYSGTLEVDVSADARFANVSEFWVHLIMRNTSGADTRTSNRIQNYEVDCRLAKP